jgi:hypothetical protein
LTGDVIDEPGDTVIGRLEIASPFPTVLDHVRNALTSEITVPRSEIPRGRKNTAGRK